MSLLAFGLPLARSLVSGILAPSKLNSDSDLPSHEEVDLVAGPTLYRYERIASEPRIRPGDVPRFVENRSAGVLNG